MKSDGTKLWRQTRKDNNKSNARNETRRDEIISKHKKNYEGKQEKIVEKSNVRSEIRRGEIKKRKK